MRGSVLDGLLSRPDRTRLLLDEFAAKRIAVSELSQSVVQRLTSHPDAEIKPRAKSLLAATVPVDRQQVLTQHAPALSKQGRRDLGLLVFQKNCA